MAEDPELQVPVSDEDRRRARKDAAFSSLGGRQELMLGSERVDDEDAMVIATHLLSKQCSSVQVVSLEDNLVGDAGAKSLAFVIKTSTTLRELYLGSNRVGDAGGLALAEALAASPPSSSLQTLSLAFNGMTDATVDAWCAALTANTTVKELYLSANKLSAEAKTKLSAAFGKRVVV